MTADEIVFAGGLSLSSPYAWYYTNSAGESITSYNYWWLLSPYDSAYGSRVFSIYGSGYIGDLHGSSVDDSIAVRPVISISSCCKVTGIGTPTDSYIIDETNCTC